MSGRMTHLILVHVQWRACNTQDYTDSSWQSHMHTVRHATKSPRILKKTLSRNINWSTVLENHGLVSWPMTRGVHVLVQCYACIGHDSTHSSCENDMDNVNPWTTVWGICVVFAQLLIKIEADCMSLSVTGMQSFGNHAAVKEKITFSFSISEHYTGFMPKICSQFGKMWADFGQILQPVMNFSSRNTSLLYMFLVLDSTDNDV